MILGVGQYIAEKEEKYRLPLPRKQFGQGKAPRNGHSKLTDLGSSGFCPLAFVKWSFFSERVIESLKIMPLPYPLNTPLELNR